MQVYRDALTGRRKSAVVMIPANATHHETRYRAGMHCVDNGLNGAARTPVNGRQVLESREEPPSAPGLLSS
jgi:hypothetical protein